MGIDWVDILLRLASLSCYLLGGILLSKGMGLW